MKELDSLKSNFEVVVQSREALMAEVAELRTRQ